MRRAWSLVLNALLHSVNAFGPVQLNFGPPESDSVEGWEAAFGTVTGTPFLQLTSLDPPVFGYWGGDYQSAVHVQLDASPNGSFSILPENVFLCLVSVPVGSYHLEVSVGNASGVASSCLELDNGVRIYEGQTLAGAIDTAFAQLQKQDLDSCLTLRACAEAVVNSWKVEEITCHSSCSFCSGTSDGQCAVSCTEGRTLTASESGTYCLARVPYAPSGLSASEVTNSSLQLSWVLGLSGGEPVIAHRVRLEGEVLVTTDTTFVDVTNLTGDTEYTFQVQALSAAGDGDLSDPLTIRTGPVLPWAPLDLRAVAGQYEVNLTWTAPSYNGGAAIVSYLVSALGHDQTWTSASTEVTADGLEGYSVYTFEVQALNSAGYGAANTTEIRTLQVPPGPVEQLNVSRAEQYLLRLDWSPPSFDGGDTVSGYYIWCQASQPGVAIANQSSSQTFALLKDLQGYTLYQCRVSALNGLGLSMASWIQARTLAVPPHQPGQPIVEEEQLHKVKLSWAEPEGDSGANLSGYKVYGSMDSMNWYVVWNDTQSPNTTWWILDLEAYTVYYFTIAGLNEIGEGLKSEMVSAYTAPVGLPHPPSLPVINTSHSRLQVSWTLLNDGGTNVTGFEVELAESGEAFEAALNVSEPFVTISGLLGNITYRVRIRALSTGGRSYPSHIAEATTDAPVVPDAPADLRMEALAPHTAWLRFTAPLDEGGRPVEGYEILVTTEDAQSVETLHVNASQVDVEVLRLQGSQSYEFLVFAWNAIGRSSSGTSANLTMPEPEEPGEPQGIQLSNLSLEWSAPSHDGGARIEGFEVWSQVDEGDWALEVTTNETAMNLTGMVGDTLYRFQVRALNRVGAGAFAAAVELRTAASAPPAVRNLVADVADNHVRLRWWAPEKDGGFPIIAYRIQEEADEIYNTSGNVTEIMVESLLLNTSYHFLVSGVNLLGAGESKSIWVLTRPVVPQPVAAPRVGSRTASKLNVTWTAPENGGLRIDFYTVEMFENGLFLEVGNVTQNALELVGLQANQSYVLRTFAWNALGRSSEGDIAVLETADPSVPEHVEHVAIDVVNWSAHVAWAEPLETGGLELFYQVAASAEHHELVSETSHLSALLSALRGDQVYNFTISACNSVGCTSSLEKTWSMAASAPPQVEALRVQVADQTALLSWEPPHHLGGGLFVAYQVELGQTTWQVQSSNITIPALEGDSEYRFRVQVVTTAGLSPWVEVDAQTAEVPPFPPSEPNISEIYEDSMRLDWNHPKTGGFEILKYRIFVRWEGNWTSYDTEGNMTSFVIEGLQAATLYDLAVAGINRLGVGQQSPIVSHRSLALDPARPGRVQAALVGETFIALRWTPPNATFMGYVLALREPGTGNSSQIVTSQYASHVWRNLQGGTTYHFQAQAQSPTGTSDWGPESKGITTRTEPLTSPYVANMEEEEATLVFHATVAAAVEAERGGTPQQQIEAALRTVTSFTAEKSIQEQASLAAQAAASAAVAAGMRAEEAVQAAGAAAASVARDAGLSAEAQTSLAGSAAAEAANRNQMTAEQQAQLAGEAAASAGALANMSMADLAEASADAAQQAAVASGRLGAAEALALAQQAEAAARQLANCQLPGLLDELLCLATCAAEGSLMVLGGSDLSCSASSRGNRSVSLTFEMDFGNRPSDFARSLLKALQQHLGSSALGVAKLEPGSIVASVAVSGAASDEESDHLFEQLEALEVTELKALDPLFASLQDNSVSVTSQTSSTSAVRVQRRTSTTLAPSTSTTGTNTSLATSTLTSVSNESNESEPQWQPQYSVVPEEDPDSVKVYIFSILGVMAFVAAMVLLTWWCARGLLQPSALRHCLGRCATEDSSDFGGVLPVHREAWVEADGLGVSKSLKSDAPMSPASPKDPKVEKSSTQRASLAEHPVEEPLGDVTGLETPRQPRGSGMGTSSLMALEEADDSGPSSLVPLSNTPGDYQRCADAMQEPIAAKSWAFATSAWAKRLRLGELQDEQNPDDFKLPEEPSELRRLFGVDDAPGRAPTPPERGHTPWSLPGSSISSNISLLQ